MGGQKDLEQKEGQGKRQVLGMIERIYSRERHLGEQREFGKCERSIKSVTNSIRTYLHE